jgi:hypothetical protein
MKSLPRACLDRAIINELRLQMLDALLDMTTGEGIIPVP